MLVTAVWMAVTIWGGFVLVARVYKHMAMLRETEDKLYHDYQTVLEGRKELTLNRERAEYVLISCICRMPATIATTSFAPIRST